MASDHVLELLRREPASDEYAAIRDLWKRHSIAEENRDLPGLISTLTDDCVYELVQTGHRWEGHEFLHTTAVGLYKRYPARGRDGEVEVTLLKEPVAAGTRWHDAQGDCEVISRGVCTGPRGELPDCVVIACRLGQPTATVVTSTYARDVGMVRQELDVVQFVPGFHASGPVPLPCDSTGSGHSTLRLTAFHVAPR